MPAPRSRSKRYNSEYQSHFKKFSSKRPITVKGEVTRSFSPVDLRSIGSTPRAGLQSMQLGVIHEPPLQRKRIVPYENNHNIFATGTVKEIPEGDWLASDDRSSVSSYSAKNDFNKSNGHHHYKSKGTSKARETPVMAAERKLLRSSSPPKSKNYPYIPDRISRKSTYTQDFAETGRKSRTKERQRKSASPTRKPKTAITPDKLPAAGIRTATSMGDARLLRTSDNSDYMRSPDRKERERVYDSEYKSRFKLVDGTWIESPELQERPSPVHMSERDSRWYNEALSRRNEAYGYAHRERGTHFSRKELDHQNRLQAQRHDDSFSSVSESVRSTDESPKKRKNHKNESRKSRENGHDKPPPPRRDAWAKRPDSPVESEYTHTTYSEADTTEGPNFLERGRSPTPELREAGQSRRHHYDLTTNILNDKLHKSLTFSDKKKTSSSKKHNGHHQVSYRDHNDPSPPPSVGNGSEAGSYKPPQNGNREDDVMSESAMSSRASVASETLTRARKRRDVFWEK